MDIKTVKQEVAKLKDKKRKGLLMDYLHEKGESINTFSEKYEMLLKQPEKISEIELKEIFNATGLDMTILEEQKNNLEERINNIIFELIEIKKEIKGGKNNV